MPQPPPPTTTTRRCRGGGGTRPGARRIRTAASGRRTSPSCSRRARSQGGFEQAVTADRARRRPRSPPTPSPRSSTPSALAGAKAAKRGGTSLRDDSDQDPLDDGILPGLSGIGSDGQRSAPASPVPPALGQRARRRHAAQGALAGERRHRARDHERAGPVPGRCPRHRLLARPDRHAVRDRGRARRQGRAHHGAHQQHRLRRGVERGAHPRARSRARARSASRSPMSTARS